MDIPKFKELKLSEIKERNFRKIEFKYDGAFHYFDGTNIFSHSDINRNDRFPHIVEALRKNKVGECSGEVFVPNGSVLDLNARINWNKAMMCVFDTPVMAEHLINPIKFDSVEIGLSFLEAGTNSNISRKEGLILDNYKYKIMEEAKIEVVGFESGSTKGAFILVNGSKVSALSQSFVQQYQKIKGKKVMAEFEYLFKTKDGNYFQPRLRRIYNVE